MACVEAFNDFQETPAEEAVYDGGDLIECHDVNRLAMLHITSPPTTTTTVSEPTSAERCKSCGVVSTKRRSPSTPSIDRQPHKKTTRHSPRRRIHGYTKLALPIPNSTEAVNPKSPVVSSAADNASLGTPDSKINVIPTTNPASAKSTTNGFLLPPAPRPLSRSCTAPSGRFDAALRGTGYVTGEDELNSAKRLKRMRDRMREMSQWCSEVIREGEEHDASKENIYDSPVKFYLQHVSRLSIKPDVRATISKIDRAYTAPSRTFDELLRNSNSDTSEEKLHSAKKLKGIKDCVKEIHQLCGQVVHEDEEHIGSEANYDETPKQDGTDTETEVVPASRVERAGECFTIEFKCPCDKVYQLLFSETHIYYMLIPLHQDGPENQSEENISVEKNDSWLVITTKCPCNRGYRVLLSGKVCFYELLQ